MHPIRRCDESTQCVRVFVCSWGLNDFFSQATSSTRPTQARTRPDPQLTVLFHAVPCRAIFGQDWLMRISGHFYLLQSWASAKWLWEKKKKKTGEKKITEQMKNAADICVYCIDVCLMVTVCACVCVYMHMCFICPSVNLHVYVYMRALAACDTSVFSCYLKMCLHHQTAGNRVWLIIWSKHHTVSVCGWYDEGSLSWEQHKKRVIPRLCILLSFLYMSSFYFYPDFLAHPLNRCIHLQEKAKKGAHMHFRQMVASPSRSVLSPKHKLFT